MVHIKLYIIYILIPLCAGCMLDVLFGDPLSAGHPVVMIGRLISRAEHRLYTAGEANLRAGRQTVIVVCAVSVMVPCLLIAAVRGLCGLHSAEAGQAAAAVVSALLCWQMLAAKSLKTESMKVCDALTGRSEPAERAGLQPEDEAGLEDARRAVSMIVGRDTGSLDEAGVIRAAVETVAENTCDGVIAPMFYMALLGIPGMYMYKAVNTMDSMIGYKNERYLYFGRAAARLDDVLNFIPARISGIALVLAAFFSREYDGCNAWRVFRRDRGNSSSPNAGCGEAAVAGALHIRLLGPAYYFGILHEKPYIGTDDRPVEAEDIRRANALMYMASGIALCVLLGFGCAVYSIL